MKYEMIKEIYSIAVARQDDDPSSPFLRRGYEGTSIYQLTSVQYPSDAAFSNTGFNYDKLGNRTTMTNGAATTYAANNLNQYTTVNTASLNYDANGNLTNHNGFTLSYDYENRLTSATNGTTNATYGYDAFGRRISKTVDGVTTNFVYDGDNLIAEYDSSGVLLRKYVFSDEIDEPVVMINGANMYYYNRDGLGSITELTDSSGAVAEKYQYDVFGKTIIKDSSDNVLTASAIGNRFGFTGRELDSETGLYFYRARMYSSDLGRFLQTDPIGYSDSMNLYQYCVNSPNNFTDPMGLSVGTPGFGESLIPIWGSGRAAINDFQEGRLGWGVFNTAVAVSDVFLVKAVAVGIGKSAVKISGSFSWNATREWMTKKGFAEASKPVHHWLIPRNGWGKSVPNWFKNQPWNLMPMPNRTFHFAVHGWGPEAFNLLERFWYGTPDWAKAGLFSTVGRAIEGLRENGGSTNGCSK